MKKLSRLTKYLTFGGVLFWGFLNLSVSICSSDPTDALPVSTQITDHEYQALLNGTHHFVEKQKLLVEAGINAIYKKRFPEACAVLSDLRQSGILAENNRVEDPVGEIPPDDLVSLLLAWCESGQSNHKKALDLGKPLLEKEGFWPLEAKLLLARTLIHSGRSDSAEVKWLRSQAKEHQLLSSYFDAIDSARSGNIQTVAQLLTEPAHIVRKNEHLPWHWELVQAALPLKDELIDLQIKQLTAKLANNTPTINLYNLEFMMEHFNSAKLVPVVFENHEFFRNYPDDYNKWLQLLSPYVAEARDSVKRLLSGDEYQKMHAFYVVDTLEMFYPDLLQMVFQLAKNGHYPLETYAILIDWKIAGRQLLCPTEDKLRHEYIEQIAAKWEKQKSRETQTKYNNVVRQNQELLNSARHCPYNVVQDYILKALAPPVNADPGRH